MCCLKSMLPEVYFQSMSKQSMDIHMPDPACMYMCIVYVGMYICSYVYIHMYIAESNFCGTFCCIKFLQYKASSLCKNLAQ